MNKRHTGKRMTSISKTIVGWPRYGASQFTPEQQSAIKACGANGNRSEFVVSLYICDRAVDEHCSVGIAAQSIPRS